MGKIKLLDLFCKAGGCSVGYYRAGCSMGHEIEIVGVDIEDQPNYPYTFVKSDAIDYLDQHGRDYTHIHASPPCQQFSRGSAPARKKGKVYDVSLITKIRGWMEDRGMPGVIENVVSAPVRPDLLLNGTMFGLKVIRHRKFELVNWFCMSPGSGQIKRRAVVDGDYISVFGNGAMKSKSGVEFKIPGSTVKEKWMNAMAIDWMSMRELREAIPPAYTEYIGKQFFKINI